MKRLAILGASGHGKVVADTAERCGWESVVFFDDAWPDVQRNSAWSVEGDTSLLLQRLRDFDGVALGIGNNFIRKKKLEELQAAGFFLPVLVHPSAVVSRYSCLGDGSVVFANVVINADVRIGSCAILNTGCSVDHDSTLGNAVHVSPGARLAGGVKVGDFSWIGIGATVKHLINIGVGVKVGAGAAVINDVPDDVTVAGVPARVMFL